MVLFLKLNKFKFQKDLNKMKFMINSVYLKITHFVPFYILITKQINKIVTF